LTDFYKWQRIGLLIFSIGIGVLTAVFLRGMDLVQSGGSQGGVLGPLLMEPRDMLFAVTEVQPEAVTNINIEISKFRGEPVLRFNNIPLKEFKDISQLERGLYNFSIETPSDIQGFSITFSASKPPRDMVLLSFIIGLIGVSIILVSTFAAERTRKPLKSR
jgi:hypothetical protein